MRFRQRLTTAVVVLFSVTTIAVGCGDEFGGPYAVDDEVRAEKISSFWVLGGIRLPYSRATRLTDNLLRQSIVVNYIPGQEWQRYNYVMIGDDPSILFVATWVDSDIDKAIAPRNICLNTPGALTSTSGMMVDFWIENPKSPPPVQSSTRSSPCSILPAKESSKSTGILDAISKHFFLAQGTGGGSIDFRQPSFDPARWALVEVRYAGEIIIDLTSCRVAGGEADRVEVIVNDGSGTYRPEPGSNLQYLRAVAKKFGEPDIQIQVTHVYHWDQDEEPTPIEDLRGEPVPCPTGS